MKKTLFLMIMCVFALCGNLNAQNDEVIIDGTVGDLYNDAMPQMAPIHAEVQYSISQQIYTAEEIGRTSGTIKSISFKTDAIWSDDQARILDVFITNTDKKSFEGSNVMGYNMVQLTDADHVFMGEVTFTPASWVTITLNKDFNYTGGNILVCVSDMTGLINSTTGCYFSGFESESEIRCVVSSNAEELYEPRTKIIRAKEGRRDIPKIKLTFGEPSVEAIEENVASFNVYPNPVKDVINIEAETEINEVLIYNLQGQQTTDYRLQTSSTGLGQQTLSVDISNLESGVYFVEVKTNEGNSVRRIIKN